MKKKQKWFIAYVWKSDGRSIYVNEIIDKHPFELVYEWHYKYEGNNESVLLNFWEFDEKYKKTEDYL